ncbi:MAG: c-type cytochrome [Cellvibrionaceae bacterium]|nr:c-type cytochrome [Cellvibrionaceae bacterium]
MLQRLTYPLLVSLCACAGEQSAFSGYSEGAARVAKLTWIMVGGGGLILLLVVVLTAIALFGPLSWRQKLRGESVVIGLGMVFPVVVLTALLFYGFVLLRLEAAPEFSGEMLRIEVVGEQWWWRVIYHHPDGSTTESANELRFPVGQPVELTLTTADVIHSFWLPAYGGKVDMIPGRTNYLRFLPTHPGVTRGQCAEYCGGAHALMAFYAVALSAEEFVQWRARERANAVVAADDSAAQTFLANGCGGCHRVRGTPAEGVIGPDLTHVGSRLSLGAGILSADHQGFRDWLARHQRIKPENRMPAYDILNDAELDSLAAYLVALK